MLSLNIPPGVLAIADEVIEYSRASAGSLQYRRRGSIGL
jgi:hypothetical protein